MSSNTPHDDLHELLVPYSLGELDGDELARVERALREDASLRAELDALEATAAAMLGSLPRREAPAALRQRVLDAVDAASSAERMPAEAAPMYVMPRDPFAMPARPSRWRRMAMPALSGALAAACVALLVWAVDLRGQLEDARSTGDAPAEAGGDGPPEWVRLAETHEVSTVGEFRQASARVLEVDGQYLLMIEDLPEPEPGTSWQVWTAEGSDVRNVAQWTDGRRIQLLVVPDPNVEELMISHEATTEPVATPGSAPLASVEV